MKGGCGAGTAAETRRFEIVLAEDNPADAELVREALGQEAAIRNAAVVYFKKSSTLEEFMRLGSIVRQVLEQRTASEVETDCRGAA
ncbi:MAG: hypothetical protein ACRD45_02390 [Bryobacteraceae bacterium]